MLASDALSHLTVLDLTRVRAGPTAVRQLADWGAKVVKIEMPAALEEGDGVGGPRDGSDFRNVHRNKRGMTLNLKSAEGVAILKKLAETPTSSSRTTVPTSRGSSASTTRRSPPSTRASSTRASRATAKTARTAFAPASTRSRRAWAG
jgi:hypothetical protein